MDKELLGAMKVLEKEGNISENTLIEVTENSLPTVCKNHLGEADNIRVTINPDTCDFAVHAGKAVVESMENDCLEMSLANTGMLNPRYEIGDTVQIPLSPKKFGRIATQNAKNVILQRIRGEECKALYNEYYTKEKDIMIGMVQCYLGRNTSTNLGRVDAILNESEQVKGGTFRSTERAKAHVIEVKDTPRDPRASVPKTYPDLVKRLFESEVAEVRDGIAEIKVVAREAGSRAKITVKSGDANVDSVGTCAGLSGPRANSVVSELKSGKVSIINWDDNPMYLIENALGPAKVICVVTDEEEREAQVAVPGYQLSLTIGKKSQNVRLIARLMGSKTDIKSETQTREMGLFEQMGLQYGDTFSKSYEEEQKEPKSYQEHGENYQEDGNEQ